MFCDTLNLLLQIFIQVFLCTLPDEFYSNQQYQTRF